MKRNIWQYLAGVVVIVAVGLVGIIIYGLANGVIWISNLVNWETIFKNPGGIGIGLLIGLFIDNLGTLAISILNKVTNGAVERWLVKTKANKSKRIQKRQRRREKKAAEKRRREEMYINNSRVEEDQDYQDDEAE